MISVIVPLYNIEIYLCRCIDAILKQTYEDFELLLIDDGSTDSSGKICDSYASLDSRVRVFHKENEGVAKARNYGLERTKGEYITFIDADDYVGKEYLKILIDSVQMYHVELSVIAWECTRLEKISENKNSNRHILLTREEMFKQLLVGDTINVAPWGKLFRKQLFTGFVFPTVTVYEDYLTIPYIMDQCDSCVYNTAKEYYYFQRDGSAIHSDTMFFGNKTWFEAIHKLCLYTQKQHAALYSYAEGKFVKELFGAVIDWLLFNGEYVVIATKIKNDFYNRFSKVLKLPGLTIKERIKVFLFLLDVRLYRIVRIAWLKVLKNQDNQIYLNWQRRKPNA